MTDYRDRELVSELNEMYRESRGCEYAEYELRAIAGEGGFAETATSALGFNYEHFEMREAQAVSCNVCGGLFVDSLDVMRRHRHKCGWR